MLNSYSTNAILMRKLCRDYRRNHGTYYQENLRVDFSFNDILWCRSAQPVNPHSAVLQLQLPKGAVEIDLFFWFIRRSANHDVKEWESGGASRSIWKMWHGSYNNVMFLHLTRWKSAKYRPGLLWTSFSFHFPSSLAPFAPFSPSPVAASLSSSVLYSQQSRWGFGVPYWEERKKKKDGLFSGNKRLVFHLKVTSTTGWAWTEPYAGKTEVKANGRRSWQYTKYAFNGRINEWCAIYPWARWWDECSPDMLPLVRKAQRGNSQ